MNANNAGRDEHESAWELLPWLANGTLDEWSKSSVERHATDCVACRKELELLRGVAAGARSVDEHPLSAERSLAAMMQKIDRAEASRTASVTGRLAKLAESAAELADELAERIRETPRALQAIQAVAVLLVVGAVGGWVWSVGREPGSVGLEPRFQTLSTATEPASYSQPRVRVVFDDRISVAEMREILAQIDGDIVDGPSPHGVYTVELASAPDGAVDVSAAIEKLRQSEGVRFAEPLGEGATGTQP